MQRLELYCLVCGDYQFCQDFDQVLTVRRPSESCSGGSRNDGSDRSSRV
jgi:hypothetical protein